MGLNAFYTFSLFVDIWKISQDGLFLFTAFIVVVASEDAFNW